jgi:hypothetical protein
VYIVSKTWSVIIQPLQKSNHKKKYAVSLPKSIYRTKQPLPKRIKVGVLKEQPRWTSNSSSNVVKMSPYLLHKLGLKKGLKCQLVIDKDTLRLGPVVGIFVGENYISNLLKQRTKTQTRKLIHANQQSNTILYYFSKYDVNFRDRKVKGTFFDHQQGIWLQHRFPLPDVFYDRGSGKSKIKQSRQTLRRRLEQETPVKKINSQHYFDKWNLYQTLHQYKNIRAYLPETSQYNRAEQINHKDLEKKLNKYSVYVKKLVSSNGYKIMRIEKLSNGYVCSYFNKQLIQSKVKRIKSVVREIQKLYGNSKIIVQQGIDLPRDENRIVDMRATVQKNRSGSPQITAISVRVGIEGSPVTSTKKGSNVYRFEDYYTERLSKKEMEQLRSRINSFLFTIYHYIEKSYGSFGEIGIDFALDVNDNLKLIECNSKPAKSCLVISYDQETINKAFLYPLEYAKFLSGF